MIDKISKLKGSRRLIKERIRASVMKQGMKERKEKKKNGVVEGESVNARDQLVKGNEGGNAPICKTYSEDFALAHLSGSDA